MSLSLSLARAAAGLGFITMVLAWLIPNHYPPWTSVYNEGAMAVALACFVAWLAPGLLGKTASVPVSVWLIIGVASLPWLQLASGILAYSGDAFIASAYLMALALAIYAGYAAMSQGVRDLPLLLSWAALTASIASAVIAISQALAVYSWGIWAETATPGMRAVGNLAQPNNEATLLGLGAAAAFYLYERGKLSSLLAMVAISPLVVAGALTQSRISLLFGFLAMAVLWRLHRRGVATKTSLLLVGGITVSHCLLMWAMPALLSAFMGEAPVDLATRGVSSPRYQMWQMLIHAVNLAPWRGYGWLQVGAAELAVVDGYPPVKELWLQGHNILLELIVWCGWPLGLLLGGALLFWVFSRASGMRSVESAAGVLVISIIGAHALVELPHHYLYFLIPAGLWAGIVEREELARATRGGMLMTVPALAVLLILGGIAIEYPEMEDDFRLLRMESAQVMGARATRKSPEAPLLSSLTAFLQFARTEPVAGLSPAQLRAMSDAVKRYPYARSLARYASALALNGEPDAARRTFVKIRYIYGDGTYTGFKNDLHDRVQGGESALAPLDAELPDVARLSP
jgi:hypothetical protein